MDIEQMEGAGNRSMTDAELLTHLLDLFESREEAEHVAVCQWCDVHSSCGDAGPYRCPDNPVSVEQRRIDDGRHLIGIVMWIARGCPDPTPMQVMERQIGRQIKAALIEQISQPIPLFDSFRKTPGP